MTAPALDFPLFGHSDEVLRLVAGFEDGTLPKAEWTHQAHLAVALWYASRLPFEEALVAVRRDSDGQRGTRRRHHPDRRVPRDDHALLHGGDLRIRGGGRTSGRPIGRPG